MFIIEVIPLITFPPQVSQILSYFYDQALPKGAVVKVQIQKKEVQAIVVLSTPLERQKITLKKSAFQLKKISKVLADESQVSSHQFQTALWFAKHYYAPLGLSLKSVLPPFFNKRGYQTTHELVHEEIPPSRLASPLPLFIEARAHQTARKLEPFIKKALKKAGQVLILSPDTTMLNYLFESFKNLGDSARLSSKISNADYYDIWRRVASGSCKIICATRIGLFLPFHDLRIIMVEDPFHESYKSEMSPRYNTSDVALKIADFHGARTIFIAPIPDLNIAYAIDQRTFTLHQERQVSLPDTDVVDIEYERKTGNYSVFSRLLQKRLIDAIRVKERILLVSSRRAYSGILICHNCGTFVKCPNCEIPMRVHKTAESMLVCYHCSAYQNFPKNCVNCHSTKLSPAGVAGSQKIQEQLTKFLSEQKIEDVESFILDSDLTQDDSQEQELFDAIKKSTQPIIIATQMIFSHRYQEQFDFIGIINADALMSNADFRAEERFFYQYEKLLDFQPARITIQTYNPENSAIMMAAQENYKAFYERELSNRKLLGYPPFSRLIKLTYAHTSATKASFEARALNEKLRMAIAQFNFGERIKIFGPNPASIAREKNQYHYSIILKIDPEFQPLASLLRFVPAQWHIDVDPHQIL